MRRLIYVSRWSERGLADVDDTVRDVLARSIANNRLCDITGALLVGEGHFLQALEGPDAAIEATYRRIAGDPRHCAVQTISDEPAARRAFHDWHMCAVTLDRVRQQLGADECEFPPRGGEAALDLLQAAAAAQRISDQEAAAGRAA